MKRIIVSALMVALSLTFARGAGVQAETDPPRQPATAAAMEEARRHFRQGMVFYEERDYNGALAEFETAYRLSQEPVALYQMGVTLRALFRYQEAIETLRRYLGQTTRDPRVTADHRHTVNGLIAEMRSLMAEVTVVTTPAKAAVLVDGRPAAPDARGRVQLAAGDHLIQARIAGHAAAEKQVRVVAGVPQKVELALAPIPREGQVDIVSTRADTRVRVDGVDRGRAPVRLTLAAGGHLVEGLADGFRPWRTDVNVTPGQNREIEIHLEAAPAAESRPFYKKWWFWTATGVGLAAAGTAVVLSGKTEDPLLGTLSPGGQPVSQ